MAALERQIDKIREKQGGLVYTFDKVCFKGNMKNQNRRFCSALQERKTRGTLSAGSRQGIDEKIVLKVESFDEKGKFI